jgi:hypothetical protein
VVEPTFTTRSEGIVQMTQTIEWYESQLAAALAEVVDLCAECGIEAPIPCDRHEQMFGHIGVNVSSSDKRETPSE